MKFFKGNFCREIYRITIGDTFEGENMQEISITEDTIKNRIFTIRKVQVMLDSDLAKLYCVETRILNQAVKRNLERFSKNFMFQLTEAEYNSLIYQTGTIKKEALRSQIVILEKGRGIHRKYLPYVFTEQGVAMLSAVLNSSTAVKVSIQIINTFVALRKFIYKNAEVFNRLDNVERKQIEYQIQSDKNFEKLFNAIEDKSIQKSKGIFFEGQVFDAYKFASDLIRSARKSIVLIDNYVDESILTLFEKREENIKVVIYTKYSRQLELDLKKFNAQYEQIEIKDFDKAHDRFMIIDDKEVYHFGASLKDLGKKWFAFSKFDKEALEILGRLK